MGLQQGVAGSGSCDGQAAVSFPGCLSSPVMCCVYGNEVEMDTATCVITARSPDM